MHQVAAVGDLIDDVSLSVASMSGPDPELDPRAQIDDRLRELLVGLERVRHSAEAAQADVMVALGAEARRLDAAEYAATGMPARSHEEFVPDEIGVLLACTKAAAGRRYATAINAVGHAGLGRSWHAGQIDGRKVEVITDEVRCLTDWSLTTNIAPGVAQLVSELTNAAAEHARSHTWSQTRQWLRRRVIDVAPEVAELRRNRAEADRRVEITPSDDGMSELWAVLPSIRAREIQQALTAAAHDLGADDGRTMDQRRADLLVDWLLGPDHAPAVHLHLVVNGAEAATGDARDAGIDGCTHPASGGAGSVARTAGLAELGSWLPGVGPLTPQQTSELLAAARSTTLHVPPEPAPDQGYRPSAALDQAVRVRDVTCRFPGCRRAALGSGTGTDVDHTVSWPRGPTIASNLAVLCRRHHRLKHSAGWRVVLNPDATMTWTTPSGRSYTSEPWYHPNPPAPPVVAVAHSVVTQWSTQ